MIENHRFQVCDSIIIIIYHLNKVFLYNYYSLYYISKQLCNDDFIKTKCCFFLSCAHYKKNEKYCAKLKISNSLHNSILFLMIFQSFSYKWWQKIYTMYYNETILMISCKQAHYVFDLFSDLFKWKHGNPHVSADYGESPLLHFTFLNPIGYFRNK